MSNEKFGIMSDLQLTTLYLKIRELKDAADKEHKDKMKPASEAMKGIENEMLSRMNERGSTSIKTAAGTPYIAPVVSVTVKDWDETLKYIQDNDAWFLLEQRVSKKASMEFMDEIKDAIPGVAVRKESVVRFRSPSK